MYLGKLKDNATATTNPDPNGLSTKDPYGTYVNEYTSQAAWVNQSATNSPALVMRGISRQKGGALLPLAFVPSGGDAVTMTIKIWEWCHLAATWVKPQTGHSWSLTGFASILVPVPSSGPFFVEVDAISAGNVDIYYDSGLADAL